MWPSLINVCFATLILLKDKSNFRVAIAGIWCLDGYPFLAWYLVHGYDQFDVFK